MPMTTTTTRTYQPLTAQDTGREPTADEQVKWAIQWAVSQAGSIKTMALEMDIRDWPDRVLLDAAASLGCLHHALRAYRDGDLTGAARAVTAALDAIKDMPTFEDAERIVLKR